MSKTWSWQNVESTEFLNTDSNQPIFIGGQAIGPALRICQGCPHYKNRFYCMTHCGEYQSLVGGAIKICDVTVMLETEQNKSRESRK